MVPQRSCTCAKGRLALRVRRRSDLQRSASHTVKGSKLGDGGHKTHDRNSDAMPPFAEAHRLSRRMHSCKTFAMPDERSKNQVLRRRIIL
jgi:hypothetical protein